MTILSEALKEVAENNINYTLFVDVYTNDPMRESAFFNNFSDNIEHTISLISTIATYTYSETEDGYYRYIDFYTENNPERRLIIIKMHKVNEYELEDDFSLIEVREKESSDILHEEETEFLSINGTIGYIRDYVKDYLL